MRAAYFAGGCFWCLVEPFDSKDGIGQVTAGYAGGSLVDPTYEDVKTGTTGHAETIKITYDEAKWSFAQLLEIYLQLVDATDAQGQFMDRGSSYRPVIFYTSENEREIAAERLAKIEGSVIELVPYTNFYEAEPEHQGFYKRNPEKMLQEKQERQDWLENRPE
ncbi:MAG: peptide-methionine (S)-S-oxide reductase MsrA [Lactobacillales bacterium]|nr:peptide-methionine (S)-S-oxide reductase MsrA [Lactobacillales bacterium]